MMKRVLLVMLTVWLCAAGGCGGAATTNPNTAAPNGAAGSGSPATAKLFHAAVKEGHLDDVRAGLDAHPEWIRSTESHWEAQPLQVAAYEGHLEIVKLLIARGADVDACHERWRWRPIHEAAAEGHLEIARVLLDHGAKVNVKNLEGHTPLALAAGRGHGPMVDLLLDRGAQLQDTDREGRTLLHLAAGKGDTALAEVFLERGLAVDARAGDGRTPLHWAADGETVRLLVGKGADAKAKGKAGRTPLHVAAFFGRDGTVEALIAAGADVNAKDDAGRTPLDLATEECHAATAQLLRSRGAQAGTSPKPSARITRIGPKGQFILNGKPIIPFGVWQQPEYLMEYHRHLGADCMVYPPSGGASDESSTPGYVRAAQQAGLGAFVHYHDNLADSPAVWGWGGGGWPIEDALRQYELLRMKDTSRVILCNFGGHGLIKGDDNDTAFYRQAFRAIDCIVPHVWPEMFDDEPRNLRNVALMVDKARELCKDRPQGEISIWADTNCHEWRKRGREPLYPTPTPEELDFQIWVALIHGADGVCLFPISFDPFVYAQIPARIEERLPAIIGRVRRFAPVLTDDESPLAITVRSDQPEGIVDSTTRRHEGKDYVFLVGDVAETRTFRLQVEGLGRTLILRDVLKDAPLATSPGRYEETVGPLELRVWEIAPAAK